MVGPNKTQSPFLAETEQHFLWQRFGNAADSTPPQKAPQLRFLDPTSPSSIHLTSSTSPTRAPKLALIS
jgi:hypothetical protein